MKRFISFFLIIILCVLLLSSCINHDRGSPTITVTQPVLTTESNRGSQGTSGHDNDETVTTDSQPATAPTETTTEPVSSSSKQSGEKMVFSSDPNNAFIMAVVNKYGVNASNLVAYYASSQTTNANLVYEFNGTVGSNGRPVRTIDTLVNIYTVTAPPELLAKKASGTKAEGNEYDEKDTKLCRFFTENVLFRFFGDEIQNA